MIKDLDNTSLVLILWQIVVILLILFLCYFSFKIIKNLNSYLELKIKYLKKKIEKE